MTKHGEFCFAEKDLFSCYIKQIMNVFSFMQWNKYFHKVKDECSIQLGFASLNGTFHLSPHENICTIALINIHYLYNIHSQSDTSLSSITRSTGSRFACPEPGSNLSQHKSNGALVHSNSSVNQLLMYETITVKEYMVEDSVTHSCIHALNWHHRPTVG